MQAEPAQATWSGHAQHPEHRDLDLVLTRVPKAPFNGIVLIFVSIPHANIIYAVLGIVIFGGYTIFDFNRLRRADVSSSVPIAASIFLDIFNIFLFFLELFGGGRR